METVKFTIERTGEFISIELKCGEDHASFTAPADLFRAFNKALSDAIAEAEQYAAQEPDS